MKNFKLKNLSPLIALAISMISCVHRMPEQSIAEFNELKTGDLYVELMNVYHFIYTGQPELALNAFKTTITKYPDAIVPRIQFAEFLNELASQTRNIDLSLRLQRDALVVLEEASKKFPNDATILKKLTQQQINDKQYFAAIKSLEKLRSVAPDDSEVTTDLARLYIETNQSDLAVKILETVPDEWKQSYEVLKTMALASAENNKHDLAIELYRKCLEINETDYETRYNLALVFLNKGELNAAKEQLAQLNLEFPNSVEIRIQLANIYRTENQLDKAIEILKPLEEDRSSRIIGKMQIAKLLIVKGDSALAESTLREALKLDRDNQNARFLLAIALDEQAKVNEAIEILVGLTKQEGTPYIIIDFLSDLYMREKKISSAIELIERFIELRPNEEELYSLLASVHYRTKNYEIAIKTFQKALKIFPESDSLIYDFILTLEKSGKWKKALKIAEKHLKKQPDDPAFNNFIGYTLAENNRDLERAEQLIRKALEKDPTNASFLDSLAWTFFKLGQHQAAWTEMEKAIASNIKDALMFDHAAQILDKLNRTAEAEELRRRAADLNMKDRTDTDELLQSDSPESGDK